MSALACKGGLFKVHISTSAGTYSTSILTQGYSQPFCAGLSHPLNCKQCPHWRLSTATRNGKVIRAFSKTVCAKGGRNALPSADQGLSTIATLWWLPFKWCHHFPQGSNHINNTLVYLFKCSTMGRQGLQTVMTGKSHHYISTNPPSPKNKQTKICISTLCPWMKPGLPRFN